MRSRRLTWSALGLAFLMVLPIALWWVAEPFSDRFRSELPDTLESIAMVFGIAGASGFGLNLVLSSRIPILQRLFGGLENVYKAHRSLGRIVFYLIVLHTVFLVASHASISASEALGVLHPSEEPVAFIGLLAFLGLTLGVGLTLLVDLNHELFVLVQRFLGFVFVVGAIHLFQTDDVKEVPALRDYMIVVVVVALVAFAYRSIFGNLLVRRRRCKVVNVNRFGEGVIELTLEPDRPMDFVPGQFVYASFSSEALSEQMRSFRFSAEEISLRPGHAKNQFHPFSLTSNPRDKSFKLVVKAVGDFTKALHKLDVGASARVEGPYGEFSYRRVPNKKQVWIAGGIGITPFLSMARSLEPDELQVDLYYCVAHLDEAHFYVDLAHIASSVPGFRVHLFSSDEMGFITAEHVRETSGELADKDVFICGPPAMTASLRAQFAAAGVDDRKIHTERFGFGPREEPVRELPEPDAATARGRRWRRSVVIVGALAIVGLGAFLYARQPSRREAATEGTTAAAAEPVASATDTSSGAFPNAAESELVGHVPSSFSDSCDRWIFDDPPTGVAASVYCVAGAQQVVYTKFASAADADAFFEQVKTDTSFTSFTSGPDSSACRKGPAYYEWTNADSSTGGEVLCFNDTTTNGGTYIYWTNPDLEIVSFAWRGDFNQPELYAWWVNESGPVE